MDGTDELEPEGREHFLDPEVASADPMRQARAQKVKAEYESSTISGLTQLLTRTVAQMTATHQAEISSCNERWVARERELANRHQQELASLQKENERLLSQHALMEQRLTSSTIATSQSFSDLASLPAVVAEHGKQLLEAQAKHLEKMREPLEPRPAGHETAGEVFKHLFSQMREIAGDVFSSNPEMRKRAARLLGGAIEKGEAVLAATGGDDDTPVEPMIASEEERLDHVPLKQVFDLFQGLPAEVIGKFAADLKLKEPFDANWRQMRRLLTAHATEVGK